MPEPASSRRDRDVVPFAVGDVVSLRKPHPCGGRDWQVHRVGADLGMNCLKCGRRIMIDRFEVQRRLVNRVPIAEVRDGRDESDRS